MTILWSHVNSQGWGQCATVRVVYSLQMQSPSLSVQPGCLSRYCHCVWAYSIRSIFMYGFNHPIIITHPIIILLNADRYT